MVLALPWLGSVPAGAQSLEAVSMAERARNYGRLTLTFRDRLDLPSYEVTAENGVLRIVFDEAVETDIRDTVRVLSDYVTIARQDPDGRAIRFGLSRAVRINTMEAGETLFIDFLPSTWQGFPPPLPEETVQRLAERAEQAAREAAEAERRRLLGELEPSVDLQIGQAPTFVRYSFNWNVPFNVAVTQTGSKLSMVFDYDVSIDLSQAFIDQPAELDDLSFERDGASVTVDMMLKPGTPMRWFEDEQRFVVDVERRVPLNDSNSVNDQIEALLSDLAPPVADQAVPFSVLGERPTEPVLDMPTDPTLQVSEPLNPDDLVPSRSESDADGMQGTSQPMDTSDGDPMPLAPAEDLEALAQRPDVASAPSLIAGRAPEVSPTSDSMDPNMIRVEVRNEDDHTRLLFPFSQPTPAAAFRRESFITLVFETPIPFDLRSLRLELSDRIRQIQPTRVNDLNLIHIELREEALVSLVPSGNRWVVVLGDTITEPPRGVQIDRATFPDGRAYAEIVEPGFSTPRRILHPHVGDHLFVVPALRPTRGALAHQSLVEFDLLPSAQGLVIRPKIDALSVDVDDTRVQISRDEGLTLSELGLSLGSFGFSPNERPGYFDLREYAADGPASFADHYASYQNAIAGAEGAVRLERLLDFARFLIAFGMGQEANGLLDIALAENPSLEHDESYLTIRVAALSLANRSQEALQIARSHAMAEAEDAALWGLLSEASLGNWPAVNGAYDDVALLFNDYPGNLIAQVMLAGVEASLEVGAIDQATERLGQVDPTRLAGDPRSRRLDLLQARVDLAKGRTDEALERLDRLRDRDGGPVGSEATLVGIQTRIQDDRVTIDEALDQLENLAVAWRGDDTEVETRVLLGDLYVELGRYSDALTALKGILIAQPDHRDADDVADTMQSIFVDLFLNGEADRLAAIDALSLFYDFRELTPIGRRGDELVRRLADRLVSIDLLDQAAELLEHQVDNRLTGTAKSQIAADLALIYLMDYRPTEAVAVLQRSRVSQVPMVIERGRRVIEARALSELGRHELALEMLRELEGNDVAGVRADVLWNAERWDEAGEVLERSLSDRWQDRLPLDEDEMQQVLRAAIAFSFAGDDFALDRIRARFDAKMSDGVYASAFDVVTSPIEMHGSAFRDVARGIAGLNTLSRFLADYRAHFSARSLPSEPPDA